MERMEKNGVEVLPKNVVAAQHSDIGFIPCVSVLQNGWVTLGSFHVLVFYKMDG